MSEDRPDPRIRELTYQLMGMAPDAPPFPEEVTAMTVPATKQRPPMLVWAAAAAAVVLLVGLPLFLFRGGDTAPGVATTIAAPTSTVVTPSTTVPEPTTTEPTGVTQYEIEFSVYLFSDTLTTAVGDPALVPVLRKGFIGPDAPTEERVAVGAIPQLFLPTEDGYTTSIPEGLDGRVSVSIDDGVATIDFPAEFEAGGGTMLMTTRLAQVVFTATQSPLIDGVLFSIEGEIVDVFSGEGLVLEGPQTRKDYTSVLPFIFLDTPAIGSIAPSPVNLSGMANVFEATVMYEIVDADGNVLNEGFTTASCGTGCWGDFSVEVPYDVPQETAGEIIVYEESARDGSRINELRYPVTLVPGNDGPVPTTTVPPVTTTTTTLPGEAFDIGPREGDVVAVVGVAHDDVLNVREGPGAGYDIVAMLDPLAANVVATGRHRLIPGAIWSEVEANGTTGWVNQSFLAYLGTVDDPTSFVVEQLGGIPEAETMADLGMIVAKVLASTDPASKIVRSVAPTVGDLGEVTFDVIGLGDDSVRGLRLHVFGQPTADGFSLKTVEETFLCGRGLSPEGLCV